MAVTAAPCIFFQRGCCRNGHDCRFSHDLSNPASATKYSRPDPRSQVLCKFYVAGICKQGASCPYRHESPNLPSSAQVSLQHDNDTFVRIFRGALVRYGDGASVISLSLPSEYSSVRIDGLAPDTLVSDVIHLLESLGHEIEIDGLRIVTMPQSPFCSAYINTPDLEFSKTLSASLVDAAYHNLKAVPVPPRLPSWASTRRTRSNKLNLKWRMNIKECVLIFMSPSAALRVSGKFNGGRYRVLDTHIHCEEPDLDEDEGPYSVVASGLPVGCTSEMVTAAITADYDRPLAVVMGSELVSKEDATDMVKELLSEFGPIDYMTEPHEQSNGYHTATAHFQQDSDAHEAARIIAKGAPLIFARGFCDVPFDADLTAKLVYSSTFKMSKEVYEHVGQRLRDQVEDIDAIRARITCRETGVLVSLDSCDSEEILKCADAIDAIVAGEVIEGKEGTPFWVPELASNGSASRLLKEIQRRHGVLLLPNRSKREVRCFGDTDKQLVVQEDIIRCLTEDIESRHTIDIDDDGFAWLCKTGMNFFKAVVGENIVSLNVTSSPKKLIIHGSDEEYCEILAILEVCNVNIGLKETRSEESCSICLTPADEPVLLGCGHTYCTDCFKGLCRNGSTQADMNLTCAGAEDKCKNAIPLREIQAHTDLASFERLLESSFSTYIARRPDEFHYCPTPDCGHIYRPAKASTPSSVWHMCPKCLRRVCRSCHANHEGQRCEEYRAVQDFEAYKRENSSNVKDCPKCQTTLEKIDGCNHMHCSGCKTHLCWVCLQTFEGSDACYVHMTEVHGGIGIDNDDEYDEDEDDETE